MYLLNNFIFLNYFENFKTYKGFGKKFRYPILILKIGLKHFTLEGKTYGKIVHFLDPNVLILIATD